MKKLVLLLFVATLSLLLIGCNNGGSELDIDLNEFISAPVNLSISGQTLSWDEVENADGYLVFVDGEEEDSVNTNSFDFSGLTGDKLLFQVKTKAPRGMQDSGFSASIAYVANPAMEIAEINSAFSAMLVSMELPSAIDLPEEFASELVRKGMVGSDFEAMSTSLVTLQTGMSSNRNMTMTEQYNMIDTFLSSVDNIEALVSAAVVTFLASAIQSEIARMNQELEMYREYLENTNDEYFQDAYQSMIDQTELSIETFTALKDQINDNPDSIVMSITSTIEYFVSIEEMLSADLIGYLQGLYDAQENGTDVNITELVLIKEEIVNVLRETMPNQEDMSLMFQFYNVLQSIANSSVGIDVEPGEISTVKIAAQALLTLEVGINLLDSLDETYFVDFIAFTESDSSEELIAAEIAILNLKYFKTFKDDNQNLIDSISDVFTDEERELLFDENVALLNNNDLINDDFGFVYGGLMDVDFQTLLHLQTVYGDAFDAALDLLVERDGELLRRVVILQSFGQNYFDEIYTNYATGDVYDSRYEFNSEREKATFKVLEEVFYLLEATINTFNDEDYGKLIELLFDVIPFEEYLSYKLMYPETMLESIKGILETAMDNSKADQLELAKNLVGYIVDEEVFANLYTVQEALFTYVETEYPSLDEYDMYGDSYVEQAFSIEVAKIYDDFMNSANRGLVDDIFAEVITVLLDDDIKSLTMLTDSEINYMDQNVESLLDYIKTELGTIADMDATNLSEADIAVIMDFGTQINYKLLMITINPDVN